MCVVIKTSFPQLEFSVCKDCTCPKSSCLSGKISRLMVWWFYLSSSKTDWPWGLQHQWPCLNDGALEVRGFKLRDARKDLPVFRVWIAGKVRWESTATSSMCILIEEVWCWQMYRNVFLKKKKRCNHFITPKMVGSLNPLASASDTVMASWCCCYVSDKGTKDRSGISEKILCRKLTQRFPAYLTL